MSATSRARSLAILDAPDELVRGEAFNVGSAEQNYLIRDLAAVLAEVTGCEIESHPTPTPDPRSYRVDFSRARAGVSPLRFKWDSRRGSEELVDAYRALPLTTELFEGRQYVHLRQLRHLLDSGALEEGLRWTAAASM